MLIPALALLTLSPAKAAKEPETIEAAAQPALDLEPSAPADQQNMVSDFEADLDSMLDALIPKK